MTAMKDALKAAALGTAEARLQHIGVAALAAHPRQFEKQCDAVLQAVSKDAGLMWEFFKIYRKQAVRGLLDAVADKLQREAREKVIVGSSATAINTAAPSRDLSSGNGGGGRGHQVIDSNAVQPFDAPSATPSRRTANERVRMRSEMRDNEYRGGLLEHFQINSRPLGDTMPVEAIAWAEAQGRNVRFVRMVVANLPPDLPIRRFRDAAELQALYDGAKDAQDNG